MKHSRHATRDKAHRIPLKSLLLLTSFAFMASTAAPTFAQDSSDKRGLRISSTSNSQVNYFINKLSPPAPINYASPKYRKGIVTLSWYDSNRRRSTIVNLKRTFDISGLFEGTSTKLSQRATAILDDLGEAITSEGINTRMYAIAAHTDANSRKSVSQKLSMRRAKVVKAYLRANFQISRDRLLPVGFGSYNLKDKKRPGAQTNNRIEICLIEDLYNHKPTTTIQLPRNTLGVEANNEDSNTESQILLSSAKDETKTPAAKKKHKRRKTHTMTQRHKKRHKRKHTITMRHKNTPSHKRKMYDSHDTYQPRPYNEDNNNYENQTHHADNAPSHRPYQNRQQHIPDPSSNTVCNSYTGKKIKDVRPKHMELDDYDGRTPVICPDSTTRR